MANTAANTAEKNTYQREWFRNRWKTDPEWAERRREYMRDYRNRAGNREKHYASCAKYREKHRQRAQDYGKEYYAKNRERIAFRNRAKQYGLTREGFDALLKEQRFLCPVCTRPLPDSHSFIAVDHCHKRGAVRGLLHRGCNVAVGMYELHSKRLAAYLKRNGGN